MNKRIIILTLALFSVLGVSSAQIQAGEKFVFEASYVMSGVMTNLGQVTMQTKTVNTTKKSYLLLECSAVTYKQWDSYFEVKDFFSAYVDPVTLKPSLYKRNVTEGVFVKREKYIFKAGNIITATTERDRSTGTTSETKDFKIGPNTQDLVSTIYKLRTIDLSALAVGQSKTYTIVFDQKEYAIAIKMMGKETIDAGNLGKKECYKLAIASKSSQLKTAANNFMWLTADEKKIPALIKFNIPVGAGQIVLKDASGI